MPEIKNLTDKNGNIVYPRTSADAVYVNEDTLTNILNNKAEVTHSHSYTNLTDKPTIPSLEGYATETFVNNAISNIEISSNSINIINVKDYGAKGDGVTDDTAIIEQCLNECLNSGMTCFFPKGRYMVTKGFKFNSNNPISIEGESYHNTFIDLIDGTTITDYNIFDFSEAKKVVCKNISSNLGFKIVSSETYFAGEVAWRQSLREKDFYLENCIVHGSNVQQGYHLYINTPTPESFERFSEANYTRYPLEITNGSGYNAININNFATNADGSIASPQDNSAIGIVDAVTNSTGTIFIDMMGPGRSFERYVSRNSDVVSSNTRQGTVWEVHRNGHLAIGCSVDESEYGYNTIKLRDNSPSIRLIDANNNNALFDIGVVHQTWGDEIYIKRGNIGVKFWIDSSNNVHLSGITGGIDGGLKVNQDITTNWDSCLKIKRSDEKIAGIGLDNNSQLRKYYSEDANLYENGQQGSLIQINSNGPSTDRPALQDSWTDKGYMYFDTTLNKPIWWNGTNWVDAIGTTV